MRSPNGSPSRAIHAGTGLHRSRVRAAIELLKYLRSFGFRTYIVPGVARVSCVSFLSEFMASRRSSGSAPWRAELSIWLPKAVPHQGCRTSCSTTTTRNAEGSILVIGRRPYSPSVIRPRPTDARIYEGRGGVRLAMLVLPDTASVIRFGTRASLPENAKSAAFPRSLRRATRTADRGHHDKRLSAFSRRLAAREPPPAPADHAAPQVKAAAHRFDHHHIAGLDACPSFGDVGAIGIEAAIVLPCCPR